jgi:sugar phosphate isomerase/epimerase
VDTNKQIRRREVMKAGIASALATTLSLSQKTQAAAESGSPKKPGIALQLYSVRNDCRQGYGKDSAPHFDRILERVAKMGFEAVEFFGYYHYTTNAKGLRARLDELGLKVAGTHISTDTLSGDNLERTIDFHQTIGCQYLIVPGDKRFSQPDGSKEIADIFNHCAAKLKKFDMYCGYHNHTQEFNELDGKTYWDLFAQRTLKDVVLQQDVGWTTHAKRDPVHYIRAYPWRSQIIHCKPTVMGKQGRPIIGEDAVQWSAIFKACAEVGGTKWYTIEQERYLPGKSPFECVELSLAGIKNFLV